MRRNHPRSARAALAPPGALAAVRRLAAALVAAAAALGAGCGDASGPKARDADLAAEGSRLFPQSQRRERAPAEARAGGAGGTAGSTSPARGTDGAADAADAAWSILIATFGDPNPEARADQARRALWKTQTAAGLTGAFIQDRGSHLALAFGRYADPRSEAAQRDLERVRAIEAEGGRPFARAVLAPPPGIDPRQAGEFDLRGVKARYGRDALYTLQVGAYMRADRKAPTESDLAEFRRLAEKAVDVLRREGEEAFYFHGPNGSMVTVGVFGPDDVDQTGTGPLVEALRQRHPYNLVNGEAYRVRVRGVPEDSPNAWRLQPSALVEIPGE